MKHPSINTHIADLYNEIQRLEQEIDDLAEIYTHNTDLKKRLLAYAKEYPELCQLTEDDEQSGLRFEIDKHRIGIRLTAPYSPERRAASSQRAKDQGVATYL